MSAVNRSILVLLLTSLAGCGQQLVEFANPGNPTVVSTDPVNTATSVAVKALVNATFSEKMDGATLTGATFTVAQAGTPITGTVSYTGMTATFTPTADLSSNTFTATITTGAKSMANSNPLLANYTWTFTTVGGVIIPPVAGPPKIVSTGPADLATAVPTNAKVTAILSEPMDATTLASPASSFTVKEFVSGTAVAGTVTYANNTATFTPTSALLPSTKYSSTISAAAKDPGGLALVAGAVPNPWTWTTGAAADVTAPTVTLTNPIDLATNVAADKPVVATFSEDMDVQTITSANFKLKETVSNNNVAGNVAYDALNKRGTFSPLANLQPDTSYTVTISNGAKDLAGNALVSPAVGGLPKPNPWSFRTAAVPPPLAINLGKAASFGLASRAGLTSTGVTNVNGDVALSPTATCTDATGNNGASQPCLVQIYSSPTGMSVNGKIYFAADPFDNGQTANQVTTDLNTAWVEGKNKVPTPSPAGGTVTGDQMDLKTFNPGVYHNANLGLAAGGTATLDALNDNNGVFIFQVDSSFVDSGTLLLPSKIVLKNGAQARNVWFVVGLDCTLGHGTTWKGNILAGRDVTINDGTQSVGRILAGASGAGALVLTGASSPSLTSVTVPQ